MTGYAIALGHRLRAVRNQRGMSMYDVQRESGRRFTAVAVGSYERGDRALSVAKLAELADFYGVQVHTLLPPNEGAPPAAHAATVVAEALAGQGLVVVHQCGCGQPIGTCPCGEPRCWVCDPYPTPCDHLGEGGAPAGEG